MFSRVRSIQAKMTHIINMWNCYNGEVVVKNFIVHIIHCESFVAKQCWRTSYYFLSLKSSEQTFYFNMKLNKGVKAE